MAEQKSVTFVDSAEEIVAVYNADGTIRTQGERDEIPSVQQWREHGFDVSVMEADPDWINAECRFPDRLHEVKLIDDDADDGQRAVGV